MESTPVLKSKPLTKKQKSFINALKNSLGVVTEMCDATGVARSSHYRWMKENPIYKAAVDEVSDIALDFGETQLFSLMRGVKIKEVRRRQDPDDKTKIIEETVEYTSAPDKTSVIFFLKTKGKKRGFIERQEITGLDGTPIAGAMAPIIVRMEQAKKAGE